MGGQQLRADGQLAVEHPSGLHPSTAVLRTLEVAPRGRRPGLEPACTVAYQSLLALRRTHGPDALLANHVRASSFQPLRRPTRSRRPTPPPPPSLKRPDHPSTPYPGASSTPVWERPSEPSPGRRDESQINRSAVPALQPPGGRAGARASGALHQRAPSPRDRGRRGSMRGAHHASCHPCFGLPAVRVEKAARATPAAVAC